jgi:hypothetical protein
MAAYLYWVGTSRSVGPDLGVDKYVRFPEYLIDSEESQST